MKLNGVDPDKRSNDTSEDTNEGKFGESFELDISDEDLKNSNSNKSTEHINEDDTVSKTKSKLKFNGDKAKIKKITSIISAILCVVFIILTLFNTAMAIKNWFGYRADMKEIKSTYDVGLMENKVYTRIDIKTANIIDYSNGVCTTDLGEVECKKPSGSVLLVFQDLNGELRSITDINEISNDSVEYVCGEFKVPENSVIISGDRVKSEYKSYLDDLDEANKIHSDMCYSRRNMIICFVAAIIFGIIFMTIHSNLGFKTSKDENKNKEDRKDTDV